MNKTNIYIISGFLGAGKTTFIKRLLPELNGKKLAVIENDFGEISVDAELLKQGGIEVREINSGCICCSLSGNFISALADLIKNYAPEIIIIELSGVGKLSDVAAACEDETISPLAELGRKITVVDVLRCEMYLENFGEFFENQLAYADAVVLSRAEASEEKTAAAIGLVRELNQNAEIFAESFEKLDYTAVLTGEKAAAHKHDCDCHEHDCDCHEHHHAHDTFETVTIKTAAKDEAALYKAFRRLEMSDAGEILRVKGIVNGIDVQYVTGELSLGRANGGEQALAVIGRGLDKKKLSEIFGEV